MQRAPASTQSIIAATNSWGVALGICALPAVASVKTGRISKVQSGQIAGAEEPRFAFKIPAIKVPCKQAMLSARVQVPPLFSESSRICWLASSGWSIATGPSMRPMVTSGLPLVRFINGVSATKSNGVIRVSRAKEANGLTPELTGKLAISIPRVHRKLTN